MLIFKNIFSLFSASFDNINIQENALLELEANSLNLPISSKFAPKILGSCNGLLCLSFPECCILWNPSTTTHHVLLNEPISDEVRIKRGAFSVYHGLGYDKGHDDYKLMRVVQFMSLMGDDFNFDTEIWVYSLNSGSWKMVVEAKWCLPFGFTDVFVNGSLHFKVYMKNEGDSTKESGKCLIVAFDVSKDTYQVITKPGCVDQNSRFDLGVLDGCLSMVVKGKSEVETFRVLEMREYGNGSSWTELFRFEMNDGREWMSPITYVRKQNKKQVLLKGAGELFCFDVESDSFKDVQITGMECGDFSEVCVCTKSQRILDIVDVNDVVEQIPDQESS